MPTRYLFRLDMAKDNDQFLVLRRETGVDQAYAGTPMKVGPGWIPDFLEVSLDKEANGFRVTLIELEATEVPARASCRKYLPEQSDQIVQSFAAYLDTVIAQCRSTADPRVDEFELLRASLASAASVTVHTAGGLRTSADLVEDLPLIDQPRSPDSISTHTIEPSAAFTFAGDRRLTRIESEGLRRAVRILHAVMIGRDHSGSTLKSWRGLRQKPLDQAVKNAPARFPRLHTLLKSTAEHGLRIDCDELANELANIWRDFEGVPITAERAADLITRFVPLAISFAEHDPMQTIFQQARTTIRATAI